MLAALSRSDSSSRSNHWNRVPRGAHCAVALFFAVMVSSVAALPQTNDTAQNSSSQPQDTTTTQPARQKLPGVSTTVVVHGEVKDNYLTESTTVGSIDGQPLAQAPVSVSVVTRDLLNDRAARLLSDVVKNDASIDDDYVPVGYYGDYEIRGFPIDLATGLAINGMTVAGEQDVPLENKQRVEFLKGIEGVESGIASAGGMINYVTKRPAVVQAIDLSTDQRGTAYGALDVGRLFGSRKQVGARVNLAAERIVPYMNDTDGWRAVGAGAADWRITSKSTLKGDFEYQHKTERDGSGYQLLNGTTLPDIHRIYASTMLGDQPWGPPDTYDTFNTSARFDQSLGRDWRAYASASLSHSLIQDNVIYAYGASYDPNTGLLNCPNAPNAAPYFFCPDGTYGVYDYRDPGELRIDREAEAILLGHVKTGAIAQDLTAGVVAFARSVRQPGFYSEQSPSTASIADGAVYDYVGSENIYQPIAPIDLSAVEDPIESAGPQRLWESSHQASALLQDRIHLPGHIQLTAGGRYDSLHDHNYSAYASCASFSPPNNCAPVITDNPAWLPQFSATINPVQSFTVYASYGVMLSLGPQAPWWVDNANQFLAPFFTRQVEMGAKYQPGQRILLSGALFHMRSPFIYPRVIQNPDSFCPVNSAAGGAVTPGDVCFEEDGHEAHNGLELNAVGKAASWLRLSFSSLAMNAVSSDTSTPAFDNKQVINVPRLHTNAFADIAVPHWRGLYLMPGWTYSSRKEATRDDVVNVPSVNLFNMGARYTPGGDDGRVTLRIYADNIANKRYWSDTGASYGDTFLWLGAPATVRLSAHYSF